jgi:hypothetical protein
MVAANARVTNSTAASIQRFMAVLPVRQRVRRRPEVYNGFPQNPYPTRIPAHFVRRKNARALPEIPDRDHSCSIHAATR